MRRLRRDPSRGFYGGDGWTPRAHSGLGLWYPAWAAQGRAGVVEVARDLGPHGIDMTGPSGAEPSINWESVLGGRPAFSFTGGVARRLSAPDSGLLGSSTSKTIIVVFAAQSAPGSSLFAKGASDADEEWILAVLSGTAYYDSGASNSWVNQGAFSATTPYVITGKNNGATHVIRRNGTQVGSRTGSDGIGDSGGQFMLGAYRSNAPVHSTATTLIAEAVAFKRHVSDDECLYIERRLATPYGVAVA